MQAAAQDRQDRFTHLHSWMFNSYNRHGYQYSMSTRHKRHLDADTAKNRKKGSVASPYTRLLHGKRMQKINIKKLEVLSTVRTGGDENISGSFCSCLIRSTFNQRELEDRLP